MRSIGCEAAEDGRSHRQPWIVLWGLWDQKVGGVITQIAVTVSGPALRYQCGVLLG